MPYCRDSALERGETPLLRSPDLHVDRGPDREARRVVSNHAIREVLWIPQTGNPLGPAVRG